MSALQQMLLGSGQTKSLSYETNEDVDPPSSPHTFSSVDIGTANGGRKVIVAAFVNGNLDADVSALTIGGISASEITSANTSTNQRQVSLWIASVPSGDTADVVVTFNDSTTSLLAIGVWSALGIYSNTPIDSGTSTADPGTDTLATIEGGFCIAAGIALGSTSTVWSNVTERFDNNAGFTGADASTTGANISPSANYDSPSNQATVFATF